MKKGGMHTIEAFIAFAIVLSFLLFLMPAITKVPDTTNKITYVQGALKSIEKTGILREYVLSRNLTGLNESLYEFIFPLYNFTVGMSTVNATHNSASMNYSFNYTADAGKLEYALLSVGFKSAQDPRVYVNGNLVLSQAGNAAGVREIIDITGNTITGENIVQFNFSGSPNYDYRLLVSEYDELSALPDSKNINTVSYVLAGANSTFRPVEIRVYVWD